MMKLRNSFFYIILFFTVFYIQFESYATAEDQEKDKSRNSLYPPPFLVEKENHWVDSVFESLSFDQKIAQLFMISAYSNRGGINDAHANNIELLIKQYNIGGLIFMQGGPMQQAKLTNYYQSIAKTPLMIGIDAEWGLQMRLDSTIGFPKQMMLGAIEDETLIYAMATEIAQQCKRIGIHINFAPVVDINSNPLNPVINTRSFGENKENVLSKSLHYMTGLQNNGILAVAKHFPGHGDTDKDSHKELPTILHDKKRLDTLELYPYYGLIKNGLGGVMVAHLHIPKIDNSVLLPASLSPAITKNLLQNHLKFKGLIFTDALNMQGVTGNYEYGEIEVQALIAGNDVLLFSQDVPTAIEKIKDAINNKIIKKNDIERKCKKILLAKYWMGLNNLKKIELQNLYEDLNTVKAKKLSKKLYEASFTIIKNNNDIIPFKQLDTLSFQQLLLVQVPKMNFKKHLSTMQNVKPIKPEVILLK
ncbi:MAG: hypothetical protein IPO21_06030 [Bacteroidales bacterium]|nr:hypothetical protein [Bacteroidales bacterium]